MARYDEPSLLSGLARLGLLVIAIAATSAAIGYVTGLGLTIPFVAWLFLPFWLPGCVIDQALCSSGEQIEVGFAWIIFRTDEALYRLRIDVAVAWFVILSATTLIVWYRRHARGA